MPDDVDSEFPGRSDVLFPGARVARRAAPAPSTEQAWYDYTIGYKEAADIVVAHVESTGRRADKLGYPILFLYRHHLELVLKRLIRTCYTLLGREQDFPPHHRLDDLWQRCAELLRELQPNASTEEIDQTTRLFREFHAVDPNADGFRFPEDRLGNASLARANDIDLSEVRDVVEKMSFFLDCVDASLTAERDVF